MMMTIGSIDLVVIPRVGAAGMVGSTDRPFMNLTGISDPEWGAQANRGRAPPTGFIDLANRDSWQGNRQSLLGLPCRPSCRS